MASHTFWGWAPSKLFGDGVCVFACRTALLTRQPTLHTHQQEEEDEEMMPMGMCVGMWEG